MLEPISRYHSLPPYPQHPATTSYNEMYQLHNHHQPIISRDKFGIIILVE